MQNNQFLRNLKNLKDETDKILNNANMLNNKKKEEYLRDFEKIRYELFESISLENRYLFKLYWYKFKYLYKRTYVIKKKWNFNIYHK